MLQRLASASQNRAVVALTVGSAAGLILLVFFLLMRGQRDTVVLQVQPVEDPSVIHVWVGGEVVTPGLVALQRGSRVADAIDAAGGLLNGADTSTIRMASVLNDADQIIVPPHRPTAALQPTSPPSRATVTGQSGAEAVAPSMQTTVAVVPQPTTLPVLIDINNAPAIELELLPGVGPAIAQRIIEYRLEHGPFMSLEELAEVSGISPRMVEEMRLMLSLGP